MPLGQIIAMGGGSIWSSPNDPIDDYILQQSAVSQPRICFLGTASGDKPENIVKFYTAFSHRRCAPSHLNLFGRTSSEQLDQLSDQDIIFVGGGNTRSMMATWDAWGIAERLRQAWRNGALLCGLSAGAICWFEQGLTDSVSETYSSVDGVGLLAGSICPHFDSEKDRQPAYLRLIESGDLSTGFGIDEHAALHYIGTRLERVVSTSLEHSAYLTKISDGEASIVKLNSTLID